VASGVELDNHHRCHAELRFRDQLSHCVGENRQRKTEIVAQVDPVRRLVLLASFSESNERHLRSVCGSSLKHS